MTAKKKVVRKKSARPVALTETAFENELLKEKAEKSTDALLEVQAYEPKDGMNVPRFC